VHIAWNACVVSVRTELNQTGRPPPVNTLEFFAFLLSLRIFNIGDSWFCAFATILAIVFWWTYRLVEFHIEATRSIHFSDLALREQHLAGIRDLVNSQVTTWQVFGQLAA
jgi:hypothetical protein